MPLVIYSLGGVHTHTHTHTRMHSRSESDFKKPGAHAWFKNTFYYLYIMSAQLKSIDLYLLKKAGVCHLPSLF